MININEDLSHYPKFIDSERRKRMLLYLDWGYQTNVTTINEEILIYDSRDLLAWLGGALGIFIGYSFFDMLKLIIDMIFYGIFRIIT